jgi:hypothetical protein
MDKLKLHILRWQHSVADNPFVLVLEIIVVLTLIFLGVMFSESYFKKRKRDKYKRR